MASAAVQTPAAQAASKSSKKKKAAKAGTESPAPATPATPESGVPTGANGVGHDDATTETPYIRDLRKNIRNVNKKITHASKTDSIIAAHPNKTLEELVAAKVINADQMAQIKKRPSMESQVAQLEEQLAQYLKVDEEYRTRLTTEKEQLESAFAEKLAAEKAEVSEKADADSKKMLQNSLLLVSKFLRLAAARRAEAVEPLDDEGLALEGVLLHVYAGDQTAVDTMLKLVHGSDEQTNSTTGDLLQTTFSQIRTAAMSIGEPLFQADSSAEIEEPEAKELAASEPSAHQAVAEGYTNGNENGSQEYTTGEATEPASEMNMSQEWVQVNPPANADLPAEVNGDSAKTEAAADKQSWADEQPEAVAEASPAAAAPVDPNDGFSEVVQRNRGRGGGREGGFRGGRGGERGGYRGRGGFRGDGRGRGRGRGGPRGGGPRGQNRSNEES